MGFWGIEVKPGKPHPYHSDNIRGKLHITQATLGLGSSKERAVLQCSVGHNNPIILCSLLPNRTETCSLDLKFDEDDELVAFSVIGSRSIHVSGYFVADDDGGHLGDEYESDSYGEDIADIQSEDESSDYDSDDEYGENLIDDGGDYEFYSHSPVPNSGVVIEEIMDDEKPICGNGESKRSKKKNKLTGSEEQKNLQRQLIAKRGAVETDLETEDEDGFPVSASHKSEDAIQQPKPETLTTEEDKRKGKDLSEKKRKVKSIDEDSQQEGKKKKKKQKGKGTDTINGLPDDEDQPVKEESQDPEQVMPVGNKQDHPHSDRWAAVARSIVESDCSSAVEWIHSPVLAPILLSPIVFQISRLISDKVHSVRFIPRMCNGEADILAKEGIGVVGSDVDNTPCENLYEKKKKKKNKKKTTQENQVDANAPVTQSGDKGTSTLESGEKPTASKSSQVRTFPNGLVVQELAMGKPDGKRASRGKQVSVHYIGKLQKNGKIFDSNVGRPPFKFRIGVGEVIKGWDVGVEGMRIGDKRKLIIPPAMGYGSTGAGGKIPPNAWLEFDLELVGVR
ncbi:39 kDa FK506-binding nuclear protein [Hibiscus syriacus]|uniref:peptidylprolyl isomerase n=1 Tax=Hibiscus syriacus TaxID=106335 RepID=A0A6A3AMS0_HIBSY|nr:39 kDa FK506-binding nuclear protein [Hibiscus syriacus]